MDDLVRQGEDLPKIPDIGEDLAAKIESIVETGKLALLDKAESRTPAALSDLMQIEGLEPKRVKTLYNELEIQSLDDLKRVTRSGETLELYGLGKKSEQTIKQRGLSFPSRSSTAWRWRGSCTEPAPEIRPDGFVSSPHRVKHADLHAQL
jgi:DNA polymerase/3'-5' exonuclease PolX